MKVNKFSKILSKWCCFNGLQESSQEELRPINSAHTRLSKESIQRVMYMPLQSHEKQPIVSNAASPSLAEASSIFTDYVRVIDFQSLMMSIKEKGKFTGVLGCLRRLWAYGMFFTINGEKAPRMVWHSMDEFIYFKTAFFRNFDPQKHPEKLPSWFHKFEPGGVYHKAFGKADNERIRLEDFLQLDNISLSEIDVDISTLREYFAAYIQLWDMHQQFINPPLLTNSPLLSNENDPEVHILAHGTYDRELPGGFQKEAHLLTNHEEDIPVGRIIADFSQCPNIHKFYLAACHGGSIKWLYSLEDLPHAFQETRKEIAYKNRRRSHANYLVRAALKQGRSNIQVTTGAGPRLMFPVVPPGYKCSDRVEQRRVVGDLIEDESTPTEDLPINSEGRVEFYPQSQGFLITLHAGNITPPPSPTQERKNA